MPQITGIVAAPSTTSNPDGTSTVPALQGKQGELLYAKLHGDWYTQAYRGNLFFGTTAAAGTTIPIQASSLVSTFTLFNPPSSGKNLELVSYTLAFEAATEVVSDISLYFQTGVNSLATLTALTPQPALLGGSASPQAKLYSAATFAGALIKGPTLAGPGAVTSTNNQPIEYLFHGRILLPPGVAVTTAGTAAQASAASQVLYWIENPI